MAIPEQTAGASQANSVSGENFHSKVAAAMKPHRKDKGAARVQAKASALAAAKAGLSKDLTGRQQKRIDRNAKRMSKVGSLPTPPVPRPATAGGAYGNNSVPPAPGRQPGAINQRDRYLGPPMKTGSK